ncbi:MAG: hypothetical protein ACFFDI_26510 [Promethearchaeota archaeon]
MRNLYKVVISCTARGHRITDLSCGRGNNLVIEPPISVRKGKKPVLSPYALWMSYLRMDLRQSATFF